MDFSLHLCMLFALLTSSHECIPHNIYLSIEIHRHKNSAVLDFSYTEWLRENMVTTTKTLAPYLTSKLLFDMKVAAYLKDTTCHFDFYMSNKTNNG